MDNIANHRFCWENLVSVLKYPDHKDGGVFAEVLIITEGLALPKLKPEVESVRVTTRTSKLSKGWYRWKAFLHWSRISSDVSLLQRSLGMGIDIRHYRWVVTIFSKAACISRNKSKVTIKHLTNSELLVAMRNVVVNQLNSWQSLNGRVWPHQRSL